MGRSWHTFGVGRLLLIAIVAPWLVFSGSPSCGAQNTAIDLAGYPFDPLKSPGGKIVVLIFVRTDCPIANRYAPTIQHLSAEHGDKATFWLVYPGKSESAESIRKHERSFGYNIPALRDPRHMLVKESQAQITPEVAVFDTARHLVYHGRIDNLYEDIGRARAAATTHELDDAISAAIRGKSPPVVTAPAVGCYISDLE